MTRVVEERLRVELRKRAYEESKQRLRTGRMSEVCTSRHEGTVCNDRVRGAAAGGQ